MTTTIEIQTLSFEQAMAELEVIVKKVEEGKLALEEAISSFERGILLKKHCESKLNNAKLRIEKIQLDQEGHIAYSPFETSPSS